MILVQVVQLHQTTHTPCNASNLSSTVVYYTNTILYVLITCINRTHCVKRIQNELPKTPARWGTSVAPLRSPAPPSVAHPEQGHKIKDQWNQEQLRKHGKNGIRYGNGMDKTHGVDLTTKTIDCQAR